MLPDLSAVLQLEVPVIVLLGERQMSVADLLQLVPGSIIELPKHSDEELELLINNKKVALGHAVKVGENFGIQVSFVGNVRARIEALGAEQTPAAEPEPAQSEGDLDALAAAMLAGQGG